MRKGLWLGAEEYVPLLEKWMRDTWGITEIRQTNPDLEIPYNIAATGEIQTFLEREIGKSCKIEAFERGIAGEHLASSAELVYQSFLGLKQFYPHLKSFVDLGCGSGFPLATALKLGYDAWGVDRTEGLIRETKVSMEMLGLGPNRVINGDYLSEDFNIGGRTLGDFDIIYSYTQEDQQKEVLSNVPGRMNSRAVLILPQLEIFRHGHTADSADIYLRSCGLRIERGLGWVMFTRRNEWFFELKPEQKKTKDYAYFNPSEWECERAVENYEAHPCEETRKKLEEFTAMNVGLARRLRDGILIGVKEQVAF